MCGEAHLPWFCVILKTELRIRATTRRHYPSPRDFCMSIEGFWYVILVGWAGGSACGHYQGCLCTCPFFPTPGECILDYGQWSHSLVLSVGRSFSLRPNCFGRSTCGKILSLLDRVSIQIYCDDNHKEDSSSSQCLTQLPWLKVFYPKSWSLSPSTCEQWLLGNSTLLLCKYLFFLYQLLAIWDLWESLLCDYISY